MIVNDVLLGKNYQKKNNNKKPDNWTLTFNFKNATPL